MRLPLPIEIAPSGENQPDCTRRNTIVCELDAYLRKLGVRVQRVRVPILGKEASDEDRNQPVTGRLAQSNKGL